MTRLLVTGADGRMGREVIAAAAERDGTTVVGAVNRSPVGDAVDTDAVGTDDADNPGSDAANEPTAEAASEATHGRIDGIPVAPPSSFASVCREREPDAVVDFTAPDATASYATRAAEAGVAFVTGTTGLSADERDTLAAAAERVPVLHATNFSRGIAALQRALRAAVAALPGYDVELTETHHAGKRDAPSGTAETLLDVVREERPDLTDDQHGRVGETLRESAEIGVHARRAGNVTGEHELLLAGDDQTLELTHRAGSRRVFAAGALDATDWITGREPGLYAFDDVLDTDNTHDTDNTRDVDDGHDTDNTRDVDDGHDTDDGRATDGGVRVDDEARSTDGDTGKTDSRTTREDDR